jgi:putative colanic acid biosynthesis UDP-glucose lipid carrier transferase
MISPGIFIKSCFERIFALAILAVVAPTLLLVALFLRSNTDKPIMLADDFATSDGASVRSYRFRTTGRGSPAFLTVGRFLRAFSFDELPGLWAIVRGQISIGQFLALGRRK